LKDKYYMEIEFENTIDSTVELEKVKFQPSIQSLVSKSINDEDLA